MAAAAAMVAVSLSSPLLVVAQAAVRALDTVTAFMATLGSDVETFIVAGASKRGWTTWTTGADTRFGGLAAELSPPLTRRA